MQSVTRPRRTMAEVVTDASALVDTEILSALGRLQRAGAVEADDVETMVRRLADPPIQRHPAPSLLLGAWARRHQLRLADALYVEPATSRDLPLITTDRRLRPVPIAEVVLEGR